MCCWTCVQRVVPSDVRWHVMEEAHWENGQDRFSVARTGRTKRVVSVLPFFLLGIRDHLTQWSCWFIVKSVKENSCLYTQQLFFWPVTHKMIKWKTDHPPVWRILLSGQIGILQKDQQAIYMESRWLWIILEPSDPALPKDNVGQMIAVSSRWFLAVSPCFCFITFVIQNYFYAQLK